MGTLPLQFLPDSFTDYAEDLDPKATFTNGTALPEGFTVQDLQQSYELTNFFGEYLRVLSTTYNYLIDSMLAEVDDGTLDKVTIIEV
jgi:hypothetical protein